MGTFNTTSIVVYGDIEKNNSKWVTWFESSIELYRTLDIKANYIGIIGKSFSSGKILQLSRTESRLRKSLDTGEDISSISLYSLPEKFSQAAFDYDAYISRDAIGKHNHIILTLNEKFLTRADINMIIEELRKHINFVNGEVFEMYNTESPQFYAAKIKSASSCKTLNVLKKF
ncbi:MAG TPA: hypothetical protein VIO64_08410 [Pseudobacteroides sp.]|uniref:hypothetical protein n=1 Tax=Pseudobacteroides sp. TaxID=1968840 RepID=UPI002F942E0F